MALRGFKRIVLGGLRVILVLYEQMGIGSLSTSASCF